MEQMYVPSPIDTSGVTLPERYAPLVEEIARTAHNDWYASRIAEGKTSAGTPGLVPWRSLGEAGKASALGQARETLLVLEFRFGLDNVLSGKVGREAVALARGALDSWMDPWTRLAGRLDHEADCRLGAAAPEGGQETGVPTEDVRFFTIWQ